MNFVLNSGREPVPVARPVCGHPVPERFLASLKIARRFTGRPNKVFPWIQFVYLADGKLYASDNRCIVEIDLDDPSFGPARFSMRDVSLLLAIGENPRLAEFAGERVAFAWESGGWCALKGQLQGLEFVEKSRSWLDEFCGRGRKLSHDVKIAIAKTANKNNSADSHRFKTNTTGLSKDQYWHCGTISKVISIAECFDGRSNPNSFTFPNGRGLLVQSSRGKII